MSEENFFSMKMAKLSIDELKNYVKNKDDIKKKWLTYFENTKCQGLHIHCPEGSISKDGPSAGVGMFTSLVSLLTNKPVKSKLSMTGEITLRGNVLAIGGVKEKVTAAHRAGIRTIILPFANKRDLEEIPEHIKKDLKFHFAKEVMDVIDVAIPDLKK